MLCCQEKNYAIAQWERETEVGAEIKVNTTHESAKHLYLHNIADSEIYTHSPFLQLTFLACIKLVTPRTKKKRTD